MSEQEVRDGLAALVVDEPPLSFDPDALMARADGATRRRRTLIGAGSATLAIAAAAVVLPIALRGGGAGPASVATPGHGPVLTTAPSKPKPSSKPYYTVEQLKAKAHELQTETQRIFPQAVPQAAGTNVRLYQGESAEDYHDGQLTLNTAVSFHTTQGKAAVTVEIFAGGTGVPPAQACKNDGTKDCHTKVLDDGTTLIVENWKQDQLRAQTVRHDRPGGVVVVVTGFNTDGFVDAKVPYLSKIPVNTTQLTTIATDRALTM